MYQSLRLMVFIKMFICISQSAFHIAVIQELLLRVDILEDHVDNDTEKGNALDYAVVC